MSSHPASVRVSMAVKRHHDHSNLYQEKHLQGGLKFQRLGHYHHGGTQWSAGRCGAGDRAESSTS